MNNIAVLINRTLSKIVGSRSGLPRGFNKVIDNVAKNPDGLLARLIDGLLGSVTSLAQPTEIPDSELRLFIGPTNYSGQGYAWARSAERHIGSLKAKNLEVEIPGGFAFPSDSRVLVSHYNRSKEWQRAEFRSISSFSHVLVEAERPLVGSLFRRNPELEIRELENVGVSVAMMCHGTDIRSPKRHVEMTSWSPYIDEIDLGKQHQKEVDNNLDLLRRLALPVFVSTPDLILDVPSAMWCPVVVDMDIWSPGPKVLESHIPSVLHIPSMGVIKGTHLIEEQLWELDRSGTIRYVTAQGIPSHEMPDLIRTADIVLDQFRIGSYGVAAVEAMATGRITLGHIASNVRDLVKMHTGRDLPIVEATPDSLTDTIHEILDNREKYQEIARKALEFSHVVHDGEMSANILQENWILKP